MLSFIFVQGNFGCPSENTLEMSREEEGGDYNNVGNISRHSWFWVGAMEMVGSENILVTC